jgi:hypothetical protein
MSSQMKFNSYLLEKGECNAGTDELAHVLGREGPESVELCMILRVVVGM